MKARLLAGGRATLARLAGSAFALLLLALLLPLAPLERSAPLRAALSRIAAPLEAQVELERLRVARLPWQGLDVRGLVLTRGEARFTAPRARIALAPGALLRARIEPLLTAEGFRLELPEAAGGAWVGALRAALGPLPRLPGFRLALRGGELYAGGQRHLAGVHIDAASGGERAALDARAHQPGGGRLELRFARDPLRGLRLDVFPSRLRVDLDRPLAALGLAEAETEGAPLFVSGHWLTRAEPGGARSHDVDLELGEGERGDDDSEGLGLRLVGRVATAAGRFVPVSRLGLSGALRFGSPRAGLWVAGPVRGRLVLSGRSDAPSVDAQLELDATRVHATQWLRKPAGVRARFALRASPRSLPEARIELGELHARAELGPEGRWLGSTEWLDAAALGRLLPALDAHVASGRLRLPAFALSPSGAFASAFAAEDLVVVLDDAVAPLRLDGTGRLDEAGLTASELRGRIGSHRFDVDLALRPHGRGVAARFDARLESWQVARAPADVSSARGGPGGSLPPAFLAAAQAPLTWLRDELGALTRVEIERSRLRIGQLRAPGVRLEQVDLELAMRNGRLALPRLAWREAGRERLFTGAVDLNPLVPTVDLAVLH